MTTAAPCANRSFTASSRCSARTWTTTRCPPRRSVWAVALPSPSAEPVTKTLLMRSPRISASRGSVLSAFCLLLSGHSRSHEHLDRLALVHCPIAVRDAVEADAAVEHATRLDPPLQ